VHLAIEPEAAQDFATVGLERAAVIVQMDAGDPRDESVGDAGGQRAGQEGILAVLAPTADDVIALV
jgi:hypothetical protein